LEKTFEFAPLKAEHDRIKKILREKLNVEVCSAQSSAQFRAAGFLLPRVGKILTDFCGQH
jgi:hypothetical protein